MISHLCLYCHFEMAGSVAALSLLVAGAGLGNSLGGKQDGAAEVDGGADAGSTDAVAPGVPVRPKCDQVWSDQGHQGMKQWERCRAACAKRTCQCVTIAPGYLGCKNRAAP